MFGSDDRKNAADTKFRNVGTGHYVGFRCPACNVTRPTDGRRKQWVPKMGPQFVCKHCAVK